MKVARLQVLLLFCFVASLSYAQDVPKNSIKVGFGTAYLNSGNYFGRHRSIDYQRSLLPRLQLGLNVGLANLSKSVDATQQLENKAVQGEVNLYFAPISNRINRLKFGVGGVYRNAEETSLFKTINDSTNIDPVINKSDSYGYTALVEYELYIAKHLMMGTRISYQQFQNNDRVFYWGLSAGVRF